VSPLQGRIFGAWNNFSMPGVLYTQCYTPCCAYCYNFPEVANNFSLTNVSISCVPRDGNRSQLQCFRGGECDRNAVMTLPQDTSVCRQLGGYDAAHSTSIVVGPAAALAARLPDSSGDSMAPGAIAAIAVVASLCVFGIAGAVLKYVWKDARPALEWYAGKLGLLCDEALHVSVVGSRFLVAGCFSLADAVARLPSVLHWIASLTEPDTWWDGLYQRRDDIAAHVADEWVHVALMLGAAVCLMVLALAWLFTNPFAKILTRGSSALGEHSSLAPP
jgi:hypothetical protein